jgi:hypothetical protein
VIAILNDTHFGARNDSPIFLDHFLDLFEKDFFPYLKAHGIGHIVHLGDFLDRRKFVNFHTLNQVRTRFLDPLRDMNVHMDITLGNHDVFFKNTNRLNSVVELFGMYPNISVHEAPTILYLGNRLVGLVPWITKDNADECLKFIQTAPVDVLMGHFEINGYEVLRGVEYHEGMDARVLSRFKAVYSGHFHCRHSKGNIHYLGTQYQMTFTDLGERKGFHVFDPDTGVMEFMENPRSIFHEIVYDDRTNDYAIHNCKPYVHSFVRMRVEAKTRPIMFDNLLDRLNEAPVHSVTIVDESDNLNSTEGITAAADISKDTLTLICDDIDCMDGVVDPVRLKTLVREIYAESVQG